MPKINGLELLELIRRSDMYLPFLIVSATFDQEMLINAINLNVSSFLPKPINLQSLIEKIDMLCERKYFKYKEELRKNEITNYLDSVNSVAYIYKMDSDGKISYMNNLMFEITGYKEKDIKSLSFTDIIHPHIPKSTIVDTFKTLKEGKLWKGNTKFISKTKEEFYLNNTIFKLVSEEDSYITISFLTTKENLEKRDFHKKVIQNMNELHSREFYYKKKLEKLSSEKMDLIVKVNATSNLEDKILSLNSQIDKYEKELTSKDEKYDLMLKSKKEEIEKFIEKAQKEMIKNSDSQNFKDSNSSKVKALIIENEKYKKLNNKLIKRVKDLEEVFKIEKR